MTSLRRRLIRIVLFSGLLTAVAVGIGAGAFYVAQRKWNVDRIGSQMRAKSVDQVKELAASYLIPEQSAGRRLLLDRQIADENLESASVIGTDERIPDRFIECRKMPSTSICESRDGNAIAVLAPISESNVVFGYLLKTKRHNSEEFGWILNYAGVALLALVLVIATIIALISRAYGQVLDSLKALEDWTGKNVRGASDESSPQIEFYELKTLGENIKRIIAEGDELKKEVVTAEIAKQVAHDIRAPVTALSVMVECISETEISEQNRLLVVNVTQRINEIADSLVAKNGKRTATPRPQAELTATVLGSTIEMIVAEKQVQLRHRPEIDLICCLGNVSEVMVRVDAVEFKRVLSNLLNNALEAISGPGQIHVNCSADSSTITIRISDTGCGIPERILRNLGEKGLTHGRENGSGLGVYHALKTIECFGGKIEYDSIENAGTTVSIRLPVLIASKSSEDPLVIRSPGQVVVIDDDDLIHQTWDRRFETIQAGESGVDVLHFYSHAEFKTWMMSGAVTCERLFLVDYELSKDGPNGLDLIEEFGIQNKSTLVSSLADDADVQARGSALGVRMMMKTQAAAVPIQIAVASQSRSSCTQDFGGLSGIA